MSVVLGIAAAVITFVIAAVLSAAAKLIEEEIRGWIEILPGIVLRMAAMQLDAKQRLTIYQDEWLPELMFIARKAEGRPVTRFMVGMCFSLGLLRSSRRIGRDLKRVRRPLIVLTDSSALSQLDGFYSERFQGARAHIAHRMSRRRGPPATRPQTSKAGCLTCRTASR